jgi:hypothetical protein
MNVALRDFSNLQNSKTSPFDCYVYLVKSYIYDIFLAEKCIYDFFLAEKYIYMT